ncbi:BtrH N-terminal domain-containing protein [Paenibacillus sp. FJAT-26967]|uniref:BtrH N-terminal domain-containing protein n=1 Tax=Paenibacillus sp. FJAT-26967 TaxID=1729690 RepID=UPI000A07A133|nr:BtrH N-terminal domain-containing protein [Paenibacillus sp. FJAT-26967]
MTFTLYKEARLNCLYVNIAAALLRLPVLKESLPFLFNQAGLYYQDTQDEDEFVISPYYRELDDFIGELFGAHVCRKGYAGGEAYLAALKNALGTGRSAIIEADIFYLPHSGFYNRSHFPHALEVIGYKDGVFEICDHYYVYHGTLTDVEFRFIFESSLQSPFYKLLNLWNLERHDKKGTEVPDAAFHYGVIRDNYRNMSGQVLYDCPAGSRAGLEAFESICRQITRLKTMDRDASKFKAASYLYEGFRELANSRFQHHNFLKAIGENELAEAYLEADQGWMVAANLLMRAATANQFQHFEERILNRMQRVREKEAGNLELLRQWLERARPEGGGKSFMTQYSPRSGQ